MRAQQKEAIEHVIMRVFRNREEGERYVNEISMLVSSTYGPLIISSLIENGLLQFRKAKRNKRKKKK